MAEKNKKLDLIAIGELNVDLIFDRLQGFPEKGKEKIAEEMTLTLGSSSAIFASNAAALGLRVGFVGKLGEDSFGDLILSRLKKRRVEVSQIIRQKKFATGATVVINAQPERAMMTYKGPMDTLRLTDIPWSYVSSARHMHLSSYYLQKGLQPGCQKLFQKAQALGLSTSLDTNWDPEEKWGKELFKILPYVDIFLPNEKESLGITRAPSVVMAMRDLARYARIVVVKCGGRGALAQQGQKIFKAAVIKNKIVDTVGAGDSVDAGFIAQFLKGASLLQCLHFANRCGAFSTTQSGGTAAFDEGGHRIP